jgi:regulator of sigma E protease
MFPLGGYCKMRGESEFQEAYEKQQNAVSPSKGSFFAVSPWRRIIVSIAGPLFNLIFAVLAFSIIWGIGFEMNSLENRIVLASSIGSESAEQYPADEAGLMTGDRILEINGRPTSDYHEIQENIAINPEKELSLKVQRDGEILDIPIRPSLDKSSGAGKIGVYYWADPLVGSVVPASPAELAGVKAGDRIVKVNGTDFPYTVAMLPILENQVPVLSLDIERGGEPVKADLILSYTDEGRVDLGIRYQTKWSHSPRLSPIAALAKGADETWQTFVVSIRSIALLFRGIDLTQAVSGPVRITYMLGDIATEGFGQSFGTGVRSMANFLSLISIALCVMNLLPLPILDGGMVVLFFIEGIKRKPLHPRFIHVFQTAGVVLIFGLMIFAVFGDILYLVRH